MNEDQYKALLIKSMTGKRMILQMYNEKNQPSTFREIINKIKLWFGIV